MFVSSLFVNKSAQFHIHQLLARLGEVFNRNILLDLKESIEIIVSLEI